MAERWYQGIGMRDFSGVPRRATGSLMTQEEVDLCQRELEEKWREEELQAAYAAVSKAIASHRWWGWRSISNSVRMFITSVKLRLGMRLWP